VGDRAVQADKMNKSLTWTVIAILLQTLRVPACAGTHTVADAMFDSASSADISEHYEDAAAKYQDLISKIKHSDPANLTIIRAQARLARIYLLQNHFDKAEPLFYQLTHTDRSKLDLAPELMIDLDDLSDTYVKLAKDPHYGYEGLKHCLALRKHINPNHPRLPDAYRQLSEYCAGSRSGAEAIDWILKAIEIERHYAPAKQAALIRDENYLASMYLAGNVLEKARATAQDALDTLSKNGGGSRLVVQLHTTLACVYTRKGFYDLAEKEYQLALKNIDTTDKDRKAILTRIMSFRQQNELLRKKAKGGRH